MITGGIFTSFVFLCFLFMSDFVAVLSTLGGVVIGAVLTPIVEKLKYWSNRRIALKNFYTELSDIATNNDELNKNFCQMFEYVSASREMPLLNKKMCLPNHVELFSLAELKKYQFTCLTANQRQAIYAMSQQVLVMNLAVNDLRANYTNLKRVDINLLGDAAGCAIQFSDLSNNFLRLKNKYQPSNIPMEEIQKGELDKLGFSLNRHEALNKYIYKCEHKEFNPLINNKALHK